MYMVITSDELASLLLTIKFMEIDHSYFHHHELDLQIVFNLFSSEFIRHHSLNFLPRSNSNSFFIFFSYKMNTLSRKKFVDFK